MTRKRKDGDFIPGIYNYCDRWCERCPMTSRCAVYADEQAAYLANSRDAKNDAFWHEINETVESIGDFLAAEIDELNAEPDEAEMAEYEEKRARLNDFVERHPLHRTSMAYMDAAHVWLEGVDELFQGKERDADRDDIVDIISWYHMQIHVKLARALQGKEEGVPDIIADMPKDSDGSAKVALIGMDRSLAAWFRLKSHLPEREDEIREFLIRLERLRRATEREFPDARPFIRPGFDDR
jgi:hypothetical protein